MIPCWLRWGVYRQANLNCAVCMCTNSRAIRDYRSIWDQKLYQMCRYGHFDFSKENNLMQRFDAQCTKIMNQTAKLNAFWCATPSPFLAPTTLRYNWYAQSIWHHMCVCVCACVWDRQKKGTKRERECVYIYMHNCVNTMYQNVTGVIWISIYVNLQYLCARLAAAFSKHCFNCTPSMACKKSPPANSASLVSLATMLRSVASDPKPRVLTCSPKKPKSFFIWHISLSPSSSVDSPSDKNISSGEYCNKESGE